MLVVLYIVAGTVKILIGALQLLMFCRALTGLLPFDENSVIVRFLYSVTEPIVIPVRYLFDRFHILEGIPLDMPFFCTFILLTILNSFL